MVESPHQPGLGHDLFDLLLGYSLHLGQLDGHGHLDIFGAGLRRRRFPGGIVIGGGFSYLVGGAYLQRAQRDLAEGSLAQLLAHCDVLVCVFPWLPHDRKQEAHSALLCHWRPLQVKGHHLRNRREAELLDDVFAARGAGDDEMLEAFLAYVFVEHHRQDEGLLAFPSLRVTDQEFAVAAEQTEHVLARQQTMIVLLFGQLPENMGIL